MLPLIKDDTESTHRDYIGDGLYVRLRNGQIWLTAENGIEVSNAVALEPEVLAAFQSWLIKVNG